MTAELRYCPRCRGMVLQQQRVVARRRGVEKIEWTCLVCGTLTARAVRPTG